ncbi:MAG: hypothetical protein P8Z42_02170 [Anaerolineales bacterium]|jgi:hypothetical protein
MNISREEAERSLQTIREVRAQIRTSIASGSVPFHMILWGVIWFFGYLCNHFLDVETGGRIWIVLAIGGSMASGIMGYRLGSRFRLPNSGRIWQIWVYFFLYVFLWIWVAWPLDAKQISLLIALYVMFAYVLLGLWLEPIITRVGLAVSVLGLIGYWLLPDIFYLWMAILGGGTLFGSGIYILKKWK